MCIYARIHTIVLLYFNTLSLPLSPQVLSYPPRLKLTTTCRRPDDMQGRQFTLSINLKTNYNFMRSVYPHHINTVLCVCVCVCVCARQQVLLIRSSFPILHPIFYYNNIIAENESWKLFFYTIEFVGPLMIVFFLLCCRKRTFVSLRLWSRPA